MMKINRFFLTFFMLFLMTFSSFSQDKIWKKTTVKEALELPTYEPVSLDSKHDFYILNFEELTGNLHQKQPKKQTQIELPSLEGNIEKYEVFETTTLAPVLAKKFPMIKSYIAKKIGNSAKTAKISMGTDGLHASISEINKETFFVSPVTNNKQIYQVFSRSDALKNEQNFECLTETETTKKTVLNQQYSDGNLRTFRIAIVCSGEYANFHLTRQNIPSTATETVKKAAVLSAINTSITRINSVFERDLGVRFQIVASNDKIIFLDKTTDGISEGSPNTMLGQNQTICDTNIGSENYDIGHLFGIGGFTGIDGVATFQSLCISGAKAKGVSGSSSPVGDTFDIDLVAHELGHQFGANHSFNNNCGKGQRVRNAATEPGSGSTIMGYAGFCFPNTQSNSDDYFNAFNITEMWNLMQNSATCATLSNTNNSPPIANAGSDFIIPKSTPFVLTGSATDINSGDILTYNWEQIDTEINTTSTSETKTDGPLFRSFPSKNTPKRYFPTLSTVLKGDKKSTWEVLPSIGRDLSFSFLVKDNHSGGGNFDRDDVKITVNTNAGPFEITSQNTSITVSGNSVQTLTWSVNKTDLPPINCQNVAIKFSSDGGLTYPITILASTPNDGTQHIVIPNINTDKGRILVEAVNNIFFDVSNANLTISEVASINPPNFNHFSLYPNPSKGNITLSFEVQETTEILMELFDLNGRLIDQKAYENSEKIFSKTINFKNAVAGLYLLKVSNGGKQRIQKLLLE